MGYLQRHLLARLLEERQRREVRRRKMAEAVAAVFEAVPDDPRFCVRRLEVVEHVARVIGAPVLNNAFHAEVERAARSLGLVPVKNGNRSLFRCAKRRDESANDALTRSRANRQDPRWRRAEHATPADG